MVGAALHAIACSNNSPTLIARRQAVRFFIADTSSSLTRAAQNKNQPVKAGFAWPGIPEGINACATVVNDERRAFRTSYVPSCERHV